MSVRDDDKKRLRVLPDEPVGGPAAGVPRRRFLAMLGAQMALAGATGCTRQPPEDIVPYVEQPPEVEPGKSLFYATSMVHQGYATGLLVRSLSGRPVKIDGNPRHPASLGATDAFAQASVLSLYTPGRAEVATHLGRVTTWARVTEEIRRAMAAQRAARGAGIRLLTGAVSSPSLAAQIASLLAAHPEARWCRFEPAGAHHAREGAVRAFGAPFEVQYDLSRADVVLTIESDVLAYGPGSLRHARDFSGRRARREGAAGPGALVPGNRLYSLESSPTCTGTLADHRLTLRPSEVGLVVARLAAELGACPAAAAPSGLSPEAIGWAAAVARDLRAHRGRGAVVAGPAAPPAAHVLASAMNEALGNVGQAVTILDPIEADPIDHVASIGDLAADLRAGRVRLLFILDGNPAYDAPADLDFAEALLHAGLSLQLSESRDETTERCHYHVPLSHFLESWGDARAFDGTVSFVQPLVERLYESRSAPELLAALLGKPAASGLDVLREYWKSAMPAAGFEDAFRRALTRGFLEGSAFAGRRPPVAAGAAERAAADLLAAVQQRRDHEIAIRPDPTVGDGRFADNGWLQELPKPHTKLTWDNAAILSPSFAGDLGVQTGDLVELTRDGRSVTAPAYVLPGHPDGTVTVYLGYGRAPGGEGPRRAPAPTFLELTTNPPPQGSRLGFDAYPLRTSRSMWNGAGLVVRKGQGRLPLAITQGHFRLEDRPIARVATAAALLADPSIIARMGEPAKETLYGWTYEGAQWGMAIDQDVCTGCSACVVACEVENNTPIVGKAEVLAGREMQWLRIDSYHVDVAGSAHVVNQPMMCVHCERAPCEYVCPVEATSHSHDGLNEMTYNRCVGTRYCQNNCPYKVRRFNFLDYQDHRSRSMRLLHNPDVTVRSRGVMEKCTYCVQRIRHAQISAEIDGRPVRDGEIVTACQEACPTGAIVFGDIRDPASVVRRWKQDPRAYSVLASLNTSPRTSHLARILNLNPEIEGHG